MLRITNNGIARPSFPTLESLQKRRAELLDLPPQPEQRAQPPEPDPDPPPRPDPAPRPTLAPSANPVLGEAALHGLAGLAVRTMAPHTEAHPAAILLELLAAFGNLVGRGPHCMVDATRHGLNLFVVLVGDSSNARKGTSWSQIARLFAEVDRPWLSTCVTSARLTGSGLVPRLRSARSAAAHRPPSPRALGGVRLHPLYIEARQRPPLATAPQRLG